MSNLNNCQIMGRLGKDVELRYMPNGNAVANFSVAVSESWKDKQTGERKESTEWFSVVMFGRNAEVASEFLKKGSRVYLAGKIKTRSWDKDGQKHYKTELHADAMQFLDKREAGGYAGDDNGFYNPATATARADQRKAPAPAAASDFDDDIQF